MSSSSFSCPLSSYVDQARLASLFSSFEAEFGSRRQDEVVVVVRVPGRVNLIGEHIDYCGYAVHPMAIEQDVLVALAKGKDKTLRLRNRDKEQYPDFDVGVDKVLVLYYMIVSRQLQK